MAFAEPPSLRAVKPKTDVKTDVIQGHIQNSISNNSLSSKNNTLSKLLQLKSIGEAIKLKHRRERQKVIGTEFQDAGYRNKIPNAMR